MKMCMILDKNNIACKSLISDIAGHGHIRPYVMIPKKLLEQVAKLAQDAPLVT